MTPTLETKRLLLRPWRESDREPWLSMRTDPRVYEFLGPIPSHDAVHASFDRLSAKLREDGYGWWVVEVKDGAPFAGCVILQQVPFEAHFTPALEIGWHFAAEQWGNGYAPEGARAALTFAFATLGVSEVVAMTAKLNRRSQRVMEKLGMTTTSADDFGNPRIAPESPIHAHVLYRIARGDGKEIA